MIEQTKQAYEKTRARLKAFAYASYLISWDSETEAPKGCFEQRSIQMGALSEESYKIATDPAHIENVDYLFKNRKQLDPVFAHEITEAKKSLDKIRKIPMEEYIAFQMLLAKSASIWAEAKNNNDFALFEPTLTEIVSFTRKYATYLETEERKGYDVLLDNFEPGFSMQEYDQFFQVLKEKLVPFAKEIAAKKLNYNDSFKKETYPIEKQRKFANYLQDVLCYDKHRGLMKESEHPFTSGFGTSDVRFTVHFYEDDVLSAIFSAIHELGHALYEQQINPALDHTSVGGGASMAMHESQSRFYENILGRSLPFWTKHYPKLKKLFPKQLKNTTVEDFHKAINTVEASLIRVEADELTYPIHIMIRYEIERGLMEGTYEVSDLPTIWNTMVKEYLGIDVPNNKQGVLQDIHWAGGMIGYFPTYALGSAYAAQIYHHMNKKMDVMKEAGKKDTKKINAWLKKAIHHHGSTKYPKQILKLATLEDFNPMYYVDYLKEKYSSIYND